MNKQTTESVEVKKYDKYHEVTFFSPKANCLTTKLLIELIQAFKTAKADPKISFIHLKSAGEGAFCAGASFDELNILKNKEQLTEYFVAIAQLFIAIIDCDKIVLTSVQGKTVGGGVGLIAVSDYVILKKTAAVKLSELSIGLAPFIIGPIIERKIGVGRLSYLSLCADWETNKWAHESGLISEIADSDEDFDKKIANASLKFSGYDAKALVEWRKRLWFESDNTNKNKQYWEELLISRARESANNIQHRVALGVLANHRN